MKQIFSTLMATLLLVTSLVGCAPAVAAPLSEVPPAATSTQSVAPAPSETEKSSGFPVTVTDAAGRAVTIDTAPQTLVSGYYITTSMLIALGQEDKLVGIEAKANKRPIYALAAPNLLELPSVGTAKEFDLEGCAALKPELVIVPLKLKTIVPALEELGIKALLVNPESLEQLADTITLLGRATGAVEQSEKLLTYNAQTAKDLEALLATAAKPTVYLAGNSSYLNTAGAKMYQHTLITMGGGTNVAASVEDNYWAQVSYEQLLAWNPAVIVIAPEASYTKEDLMQDPQLAGLDALKSGQVYAMPKSFEAWDSPVPSAMVGTRWMASVLHAPLYSFDTFSSDAAEFYSTFYGSTIDKNLLTK